MNAKQFLRTPLGIFLSAAAVAILFVTISELRSPTTRRGFEPVTPRPTPKARITLGKYQISILNTGTDDWPDLRVYINGEPPNGFKFPMGIVKGGNTVAVDLAEFTKEDGQRFKPDDYAVTEVWIGGGGYDYAKFSK